MTSLNNAGYVNPRNPIAQSFYVEEEEGIFLTQIDCFFEATASNAPVSLHLRPVINGFPSISDIVPGFGCKSSQVHIPTEQIGKIEFDISPSSKPMVSR